MAPTYPRAPRSVHSEDANLYQFLACPPIPVPLLSRSPSFPPPAVDLFPVRSIPSHYSELLGAPSTLVHVF